MTYEYLLSRFGGRLEREVRASSEAIAARQVEIASIMQAVTELRRLGTGQREGWPASTFMPDPSTEAQVGEVPWPTEGEMT